MNLSWSLSGYIKIVILQVPCSVSRTLATSVRIPVVCVQIFSRKYMGPTV